MNESTPTRRSRSGLDANLGSMSLSKIGVRRFDWTDPYHIAVTLRCPGFFALLVALYLGLNLIFAVLYVAAPGSIANARSGSLADAFFFSVQTLATVEYGVMAPQTLYGHIVSSVETFVGLVFTAMMTGLVFVRFSRPKAKLIFASHAVVSTDESGRRTLMLRIGNGRPHAMMDATARITTLVSSAGANGQMFRRVVDLKLARSDLPFFPLTWTLIHEIDEQSVLHDLFLAEARSGPPGLRLMVTITARDPALDATVSVLRTYDGREVRIGMRYVDAVSWDGHDESVADMRKIHDIEPVPPPP